MPTRSTSARASYWHALLDAHARSGLSLRAFAVSTGVSVNTLAYWKYTRSRRSGRSSIVPVTVIDDLPRAGGEFVLELGAARLRIPASTDPDRVVGLLRALAGPC